MPDYRQLFGVAAILFAIGFILQSIMPARAIPIGPSVSLGANPVFAVHTSGSSGTLFTNNTSSSAVITDLVILEDAYWFMTFSVTNGGDEFRFFADYGEGVSGVESLSSGIRVPAGESLTFTGSHTSYCQGASASGYYAH